MIRETEGCRDTRQGTQIGRRLPGSQGARRAYGRASRPKPAKLVTNLAMRGKVEADLAKKYCPEQIAGRSKMDLCDQPEMQVSTKPSTSRSTSGRGPR